MWHVASGSEVTHRIALLFSQLFSKSRATNAKMTHPHGDGQAAVNVSFLKPALLHDPASL